LVKAEKLKKQRLLPFFQFVIASREFCGRPEALVPNFGTRVVGPKGQLQPSFKFMGGLKLWVLPWAKPVI